MARFVEAGKKIVAVGRNYAEHAKELGNALPTEPLLFLKPTTAYITEGQAIKVPITCTSLHHEVELGIVIGEKGADISESDAMKYVLGYTLALDMTDRAKQEELKKKGQPWSVCKGFDTSCPVSSFIPKEKIPDPQNIRLWLKVNEEMKQDGNTKDMIFTIPHLISFISSKFTLEPGDLILTGTPSGVGPVQAGDVIEAGVGDIIKVTFPVEKK
ncbi:acylpyruvase FAHD1, mitochondrial [Lingula anatina]|uniref:Oxaloacetate tautomerase FAHD1, mitochondrial n=1 Tax=Lingula anatina TaxID=7574 RepID=A0A1S3IJE9_LINAN|nr:acylpyruvase FAHD1, mitochondrial [Lingula anatina]|eukprot:XP_013398238.1 acylpyruvase FAHD1, mitochondrial [Lingula anatina]